MKRSSKGFSRTTKPHGNAREELTEDLLKEWSMARTSGKSMNDLVHRIMKQRAGLETALGASSLQHIRSGMDQERKRVLAEDQAVLGSIGATMPSGEESDMVGDVYLGDQNTNITSPGSQFGKLAGSALLATALAAPLAAVAWKYLDRDPAPVVEPTEDTRRNIRIYRP